MDIAGLLILGSLFRVLFYSCLLWKKCEPLYRGHCRSVDSGFLVPCFVLQLSAVEKSKPFYRGHFRSVDSGFLVPCSSFLRSLAVCAFILSSVYIYIYTDSRCRQCVIVQELCESRGGRPGLSVLTSLLVSVDVKNY